MSDFNIETARKTAKLACLALPEETLGRYAAQGKNILNFVEQLNEVDTSNLEPLANVTDITLKMREDVVNDGGYQADILANAPEAVEGFFVVQKVVE